MIRTINERKAWKYIFIFLPINVLCFGFYAYATKIDNIILGACILGMYFISLMILTYEFYSLGWEYKRIQLNDTKGSENE
jgi:hypothetical protein